MSESATHRYAEGERVALAEDRPGLELCAGDTGVIEVLYYTQPPAYEVTFRCRDGKDFGMVCWESELKDVDAVE